MQISTSQFYDSTSSRMQKLSQHADTLNTQISTTKRLAAPSDDVVAYQRLATIRQANGDAGAYDANIKLGQSLLQQGDSVLGSVSSQLQKASELATQAASGTLNADDRKTIASQLRAIVDDLVSLANTRDARGQPLFGGASGDSAVTRASDGSVSFTDSGTPPSIPIGDQDSVQPTENAARVFGGITSSAGGTTDMFATLSSLADTLAQGNPPSATDTADLNAAVTQVNDTRGSLGARAARLDLVASRSTAAAAAREADRSGLEDTDVTAAITDLQKTMTVLQATQASFTKLSSLSLFDYLR